MTWTTALSDLRIMLSDGPADKLRANKAVMGQLNGTNLVFKTFEYRRTTDFSATATSFPFGITLNGAYIAASGVLADDLGTGFFKLAVAPTSSDVLATNYYLQWFTDTELDQFLVQSSAWIGLGNDYTQVPDGLKTASLKYAAHEAYMKLSLRYAENDFVIFRLQDNPDDARDEVISAYQKAAQNALKEATSTRDDYYTRKGMAKAPNFITISGNVKNPTIS